MTAPFADQSVDVAICTYRRRSLDETLASIAAQLLPAGVRLRVIVADNDETPSAQQRVKAAAARLELMIHYVHAPARNISIARNACLDHAAAPRLAFIDDDEIATPSWLAALLARMDETGADAVLGPARALYPADVPAWVRDADLHSTTPPITETGSIRTGYTCNVLLRLATFGSARFDPALGRTGGEDDVYFSSAVRKGARIAFAPDAVVEDPVPPARANLHWLCRRAFRNGQTHARNRLDGGISRPVAFAVAGAKAAVCCGAALAALPSGTRWRRAAVRGMLHLGACTRYLGWREIQIY